MKHTMTPQQLQGYRRIVKEKWSWVWQSKGYGGPAKWPITNHYHTQNGESVLEVIWNESLLKIVPEDKIIGFAPGAWMYLSMNPTEATVLSDEMGWDVLWTEDEFSEWKTSKGWTRE